MTLDGTRTGDGNWDWQRSLFDQIHKKNNILEWSWFWCSIQFFTGDAFGFCKRNMDYWKLNSLLFTKVVCREWHYFDTIKSWIDHQPPRRYFSCLRQFHPANHTNICQRKVHAVMKKTFLKDCLCIFGEVFKCVMSVWFSQMQSMQRLFDVF